LMRGTSACDNQAETDAAASPLGQCHCGPGGAPGPRVGRRNEVVVVRMVDSVSDSVETTSRDTTTVGVRVPAEHEQLVMLRALAETVALIADFGLDEVTDIRLALDEVATSLIAGAVAESTLSCDFDYDEHRMTVRVTSTA